MESQTPHANLNSATLLIIISEENARASTSHIEGLDFSLSYTARRLMAYW